MRSNDVADREAVAAAFDAIDAAFERVAELSVDGLTDREVLDVLARVETLGRRLPAVCHGLINRLAEQACPAELGGTSLADVLARRLLISRGAARRYIAEAADLGPRKALTGQGLEPLLTRTAAAQRAGRIGAEHVRLIRGFFATLPAAVDIGTREAAEAQLAEMASEFRPEQLRQGADRLAALLNPDGTYSDADRARRRGLTLGRQGPDGMSTLSGLLDPEARSYVEALFATWAAPGSCNPDDDTPTVAGDPTEDAVRRDHRTPAQRHHDAIKAAIRGVIAGGQLGTKNGLPVTVIVSTTLAELQSGCGKAGTGGGSVLPMSDLIRMASHSYHCLVIFDDTTGRPLYLGRTKRIASPDQRIVLHAKDRGCTHPGCTVPGYLCEVHHVDEWVAHEGTTDVDKLTLTCRPHHRLVRPGGWTTRKRRDGRTEWIPPPHLDHGQTRINNYHHPENYLTEDGDTGT